MEETKESTTITDDASASSAKVASQNSSTTKKTEKKSDNDRLPKLEEMLKAGVHFGHQKGRWNPKASSYIFGEHGGTHIINLEITLKKFELALDKIKDIIEKQGIILFLGTKKQICSLVKKTAEENTMPYVSERWLGGTFTNFSTISRRIKKLLELERKENEGSLGHYTKKEQTKFRQEIRDFEKNMGGIKNLTKLPEALFVIGVKEEKTAIAEAKKTGVPIIGLVDTNIDPKEIDFPIPANDDSLKSVELLLNYVSKEIKKTKK